MAISYPVEHAVILALRMARVYIDSEPLHLSVQRLVEERDSERKRSGAFKEHNDELQTLMLQLIAEKDLLHARCGRQRRELRRLNQNQRTLQLEKTVKSQLIEQLSETILTLRRDLRVSQALERK